MIGIISEGHSDRAVIVNIVKGITGLSATQMQSLRPIYTLDATDKALLEENTFSNWSLVKKECEERKIIEEFLAIEDNDYIIIQIDTAEADEYGVQKPIKDANFCHNLRAAVIDQMKLWLDNKFLENIVFAIAIEETEAWLLTIHEKRNSTTTTRPKEKFLKILKDMGVKDRRVNYDNYLFFSEPFLKPKIIKKEKYLEYNCSLKLFCNDVEEKILPTVISSDTSSSS
jgi:hypothetical protein